MSINENPRFRARRAFFYQIRSTPKEEKTVSGDTTREGCRYRGAASLLPRLEFFFRQAIVKGIGNCICISARDPLFRNF